MGIQTVAVYNDDDARAPHVRAADLSVRLSTDYLDGAEILRAAHLSGADAVHPGYGFLSENAAFATEVERAGLVWIGPQPSVIEAMGDKLAAKRTAREAGVPTLPSSEDASEASEIGFPLLVKAAAGGGGKGMRVVEDPSDLAAAVAAARREALGGFGDDRVFLERYVRRARHIEVQILGDQHGSLVHFGERECSIQRRHQKIVEESPSPWIDPKTRSAMTEAAVQLGRSLDYRSAGTVEFLVDDVSGAFYFLEVNTRLQVEHPVTEMVTGIDLVREQIRIADGEALGYGQSALSATGHAIEARLYAEDPSRGYLPAAGTVVAFAPSDEPVVRWDTGVESGSTIGISFDPMLAKVISHGSTRPEAAGRLALALERLHLAGVTTNRDMLVSTLRSDAFLNGDTTTDFIERVMPSTTLVVSRNDLEWSAAAASLWLQALNRSTAPVQTSIPTGWRNVALPPQRLSMKHGEVQIDVSYTALRDGTFTVNGSIAKVYATDATSIDVEIGGRRRCAQLTRDGQRLYLQERRGTLELEVLPRFPDPEASTAAGSLVAPMPGVVLDVRCEVGTSAVRGTTLIVLEAMKMEHHVTAPVDGVVTHVAVARGDQVDNGAVLLVLEPAKADEGHVGSAP